MANPFQIIGQDWGNFPNIITGGLTDQPDWNPAQLDAGTNGIIADQAREGQMTPEQITAQQLYGTSATMAQPATGGAVAQQQASLGGADNTAVTQALNDRANRIYSSQYNQLQNAAAAGAPVRQGQLMAQSAHALQAQQNVNDQLNRQQMAVTLQKQGMRNQIIGQILSGAGSFAGTYAGMNGGKGAGQAFASQMQGELNNTNMPAYTSDPNAPYNLTGDPSAQNPGYGLGVDQSMGSVPNQGLGPLGYGYPGQDGNGYYGEPWLQQKQPPLRNMYGNQTGGYGLGVSTDGLQ